MCCRPVLGSRPTGPAKARWQCCTGKRQPLLSDVPIPQRLQRASRRDRTAFIGIDKSVLSIPEPRRLRDKNHLRFVTRQSCLICGRRPSDAHHLRFAQPRAFGRKVSDEFTVPLCRGHHRELHRIGNETAWWTSVGIDPSPVARKLWMMTHPLPTTTSSTVVRKTRAPIVIEDGGVVAPDPQDTTEGAD